MSRVLARGRWGKIGRAGPPGASLIPSWVWRAAAQRQQGAAGSRPLSTPLPSDLEVVLPHLRPQPGCRIAEGPSAPQEKQRPALGRGLWRWDLIDIEFSRTPGPCLSPPSRLRRVGGRQTAWLGPSSGSGEHSVRQGPLRSCGRAGRVGQPGPPGMAGSRGRRVARRPQAQGTGPAGERPRCQELGEPGGGVSDLKQEGRVGWGGAEKEPAQCQWEEGPRHPPVPKERHRPR